MNPEVKKKWVKALKSGKYVQICGNMRAYTVEEYDEGVLDLPSNNMCVMGVLADLALKESGLKYNEKNWLKFAAYNDTPSTRTIKWAGISDEDSETLMEKNDIDICTFKELANFIEKNL